MVSSQVPFEGEKEEEVEESILNFRYNFEHQVWNDISDECKDLISKLIVDEKERLSPKEALNHPWLKKMFEKNEKEVNKSEYSKKFEDFKDSNHLKKAILSFLASKANDEDIKEEIELFKRFDANNDGYITK